MAVDDAERARSLLERANAEISNKESGAVRALIAQFCPIVEAFLRNRFGETFTDDDRRTLFLDVLEYYVRCPHAYDGHRPLGVLLCAAAHNNATRELFRRRQALALLDPFVADQTTPVDDPEFRRLDAQDTLDVLAHTLDDTEQKILMASKDDLNWASQLGMEIGLSPNAVAKRWERLRHKLRKSIDRTGGTPC